MADISNDAYLARMAIVEACAFLAAPHIRMRPRVFPDGNKWCCLYGGDLMVGIAGFGDTAEEACAAFDRAWGNQRTPAACVAARAQAGLIEAAPDLYASLKEIVAEWGCPNTPKWHRARAALAKATTP